MRIVLLHRLMNDDDYVKYSWKECVQVKRDADYLPEMQDQVNKMKDGLRQEWWSVSSKMFSNDFGSYIEINKCYKHIEVREEDIEYNDDDDTEDFIWDLWDYWVNEKEIDYTEVL